jgi:hypothetical protein
VICNAPSGVANLYTRICMIPRQIQLQKPAVFGTPAAFTRD